MPINANHGKEDQASFHLSGQSCILEPGVNRSLGSWLGDSQESYSIVTRHHLTMRYEDRLGR